VESQVSHPPGKGPPWLVQGQVKKLTVALVAAAIAYLLTWNLPDELNLLIPYDIGVIVYLALVAVLIARSSPEDAAEIARRGEPSNGPMLIAVMALSVISLVGVAAMLNHPPGRPRWEVNLHMAASLLTVILSWFVVNIYFGLHYMHLYCDDKIIDGKIAYHMGLEFPNRKIADFQDFIYYSFTIAMCYQTSDVSITSVRMHKRRHGTDKALHAEARPPHGLFLIGRSGGD
jgi:uncharacterized membrane protein